MTEVLNQGRGVPSHLLWRRPFARRTAILTPSRPKKWAHRNEIAGIPSREAGGLLIAIRESKEIREESENTSREADAFIARHSYCVGYMALKDIKTKIKTKRTHATRAMEAVSRQNAENGALHLWKTVCPCRLSILRDSPAVTISSDIRWEGQTSQKIALVIITSDKGLAEHSTVTSSEQSNILMDTACPSMM